MSNVDPHDHGGAGAAQDPRLLLSLDGLRVTYPGRSGAAPFAAVRDLSLTVSRGQTVAVVGESGSGKSTTLHALLGLLPRTADVRFRALTVTDRTGRHRAVRDPRELRGGAVGLVPQDPVRALDPLVRIERNFAELHRHFLRVTDREESRRLAVGTLEAVGVDRPALRLRQYPHELSGGLRQRVLIGLALVGEPRLLLADEATSDLDATVQRRVLDLFDELRASRGLGLLLVTHDMAVAAERADRLVVVRHGRVVESGPARSVLGEPRAAHTRQLLAALPGRLPRRPPPPEPDPAPVVLEARGLHKRYGGGRGRAGTDAVRDVSLRLRRGRSLAIVGESGAGKSTLLRLVTGFERPDAGEVVLAGEPRQPGAAARTAFTRRVQLVHQNPARSLNPALRVGRIVAEPLAAHRIGTAESRAGRALELLASVDLPAEIALRRPPELSGGQLQRVAIARALALEPDVIALDEPVSALDQAVQFELLRLLTDLQRRLEVAYLLVSHDLGVVRAVADEVIVVRHGRVEERGPTHRVFDDPGSPHTRALLDAVPSPALPRPSSSPERTASP